MNVTRLEDSSDSSGSPPGKFDNLLRITGGGPSGDIRLHVLDTETVKLRLEHWVASKDFETSVLATAIDSLYTLLEYNGHYHSFLCDQLSEEEFETIAQEYIYEPNEKFDLNELKRSIQVLLQYTKSNFTSSDLADIFRCDEESLSQAIAQIGDDNISIASNAD